MAAVDDVVAFLLQQSGTITTYKLHKLLYYAQGWSLAWDGDPLFDEKIKAYENGPCVSTLEYAHRGQRHVSQWPQGNPASLTTEQQDTVRAVLEMYGSFSGDQLVEATHNERPWLDAWTGDKSAPAREISRDVLRDFFRSNDAPRPPSRGSADEARALGGRLRKFLAGQSE